MTASDDFTRLTGEFRSELLVHCYRMLGSADEAEDLVQETYLRAWKGYAGFQGRSSARTWLYRIATNACLTAIERRGRRPLPSGVGGPGEDPRAPVVAAPDVPWLQPVPGAWLEETRDDPAAVATARAGTRLALVAAWQYLPARQRAFLIPRSAGRHSAAATPGPRPPSGSSPRTPRRSPSGGTGHPLRVGAAPADPGHRAGRGRGGRIRGPGRHRGRRLPGPRRAAPAHGPGGALTLALDGADGHDAYLLRAAGLSPAP
jgi:RNA polymerase sigma factor (sigma-70 family)